MLEQERLLLLEYICKRQKKRIEKGKKERDNLEMNLCHLMFTWHS
jgi:hypothetical protein